jgi:hypothetical protein
MNVCAKSKNRQRQKKEIAEEPEVTEVSLKKAGSAEFESEWVNSEVRTDNSRERFPCDQLA